MTFELFLLVLATALVTGWVVVRQTVRGRFFSLISFYSLIFLLENVGGTLKAVYPDFFVYGSAIDSESILRTLAVALLGYLIFLLGYLIAMPSKRENAQTALKRALEEKFFGEMWNALVPVVTVPSDPGHGSDRVYPAHPAHSSRRRPVGVSTNGL
jgi:hypothetical protein